MSPNPGEIPFFLVKESTATAETLSLPLLLPKPIQGNPQGEELFYIARMVIVLWRDMGNERKIGQKCELG